MTLLKKMANGNANAGMCQSDWHLHYCSAVVGLSITAT